MSARLISSTYKSRLVLENYRGSISSPPCRTEAVGEGRQKEMAVRVEGAQSLLLVQDQNVCGFPEGLQECEHELLGPRVKKGVNSLSFVPVTSRVAGLHMS